MHKHLLTAVLLSGCATMARGPQAGVSHDTQLSEMPPDIKHGVQVGAGPMTVIEAQYMPKKGTGHAALWVSRDATCPNASVGDSNEISPAEAFYGPLTLSEGDFLCASQHDNVSDATLTWVTAAKAAPGGGGSATQSTITSP